MIRNSAKRRIKRALNRFGLDIVRSPRSECLFGLPNLRIRSVLDVGANTGQMAKLFRSALPLAQIYCFEPLPEPFAQLKIWADSQSQVRALNVALGDCEAEVDAMYHFDHTPAFSLLQPTSQCNMPKGQLPVSLKLKTLDAAVTELGETLVPEILIKMDVQGYEDHVIRGGVATFRKARACILEVCVDELYEGQATFRDIFLSFDRLGYSYVGNFDQVYASDGHVKYMDAVFIRESTG